MTTTKCVCCGKFIPYSDMEPGKARFEIVTTIDGDDVEWTCFKCVQDEALTEMVRIAQEMGEYA